MLQRLPDIVHYWGYNLEGTPVIPKMYYDVYSEEQRWKEICCWLDKLTKYTDELATLVNWIKNNYATKDELVDEVLKLNNRITQEVKTLNERITHEVKTLNTRIDTEVDTLNKKVDTEVDTLNKRVDTEVDTLNKRVDTEVDTLNKRVDTEVDTLNKRVDTEIDKLNKKDKYLENKINDNFEILDTKIDSLETSQDEKRENLKNELNEKIDKNAEIAKTYTDAEIEKLKNSVNEQINNISTGINNINDTLFEIIENDKNNFDKLNQKLNEALKTSLSWNVTKGQVDSSIVTNRNMFNDLTDRSYRIQDMDNLTNINVDELAESGLNTAGWAVCNGWLWDKAVKVYPQYMVDGVVPPTPPEPPSEDEVVVTFRFDNKYVEFINGGMVYTQEGYHPLSGMISYSIIKNTSLRNNLEIGIIPQSLFDQWKVEPQEADNGRILTYRWLSETEQVDEWVQPLFDQDELIKHSITLFPQFELL